MVVYGSFAACGPSWYTMRSAGNGDVHLCIDAVAGADHMTAPQQDVILLRRSAISNHARSYTKGMNLRYLPLAPCRVDRAALPAPRVHPRGCELNAGAHGAVASPPDDGASEIPLPRRTNMSVPGGFGRMMAGRADANQGRHATRFAGASRF